MCMSDEKKDNVEIKNSKYHTLFKDCKPETKELVKVNGKDLYKIVPPHTNYRMFIDAFGETERGLHEIFNTLWSAGDSDTLELRINSWGGFVKEGQNFFNVIRNKFNGRTTTILDSAGYSMGALLFCCGDTRIVMEQSDLMFHDYSGAAWGKGQEIESQVEHTKKHIRKFFKEVIIGNNFLTQKEFEDMLIGKDFWMDVQEMCQRGIATHVMVKGNMVEAREYLKTLNKQAKNGKKKEK